MYQEYNSAMHFSKQLVANVELNFYKMLYNDFKI